LKGNTCDDPGHGHVPPACLGVRGRRADDASVIAATRAEDGCLAYAYSHDALDPEVIHVTEKWRDRAALDAHFQTPHMATWAQG
jgi:quinol monooxygenase YgiN